ncbi:hypothetical protein [Actinoplanes sp. NPDC026670]|uniref:hypothetical protein n=1 Tax=Actinoplanes sp. NPDC026670 TaxID=3154700 RepID=UPI0033C0E052
MISAWLVSILTIVSWYVWYTPDRRRRDRFFGITRRQRNLHILCSFLRIGSGGASGTERLRVGFTGPAIIRSEYLGAHLLRVTLENAPRRSRVANVLNRFRPLTIDIDAASQALEATRGGEGTLVLMGSRVYNSLTRKYFDDNDRSFFQWVRSANGERTLQPRRGQDQNLPVRRAPLADEDPSSVRSTQLAVLERLWDSEHERYVFLLVGVGALATTGAAKYLAENWRMLDRKIRKGRLGREFAILLNFAECLADLTLEEDISDIPKPTVLCITDRTTYTVPVGGILT